MSKLLTEKRNLFGAGALSLLLVTVSVVVAVRTDGYRASEVNLNDAAVWISGNTVNGGDTNTHYVGRVNTEVNRVNATVETVGSNVSLFQDGDVAIYKSAGDQLVSIDKATLTPTKVSLENADTSVAIGGGTVAALTGKQLRITGTDVLDALAKGSSATAAVDADSLLVVGADGRAYTYAPGSTKGYAIGRDGEKHVWNVTASAGHGASPQDSATDVGEVQLTVVGSTPVVLDQQAGKILIPGKRPVSIESSTGAIQQPSDAEDDVIVATENGLMAVPLDGGAARELTVGKAAGQELPNNATGAIRPVLAQGCVYGAWGSQGVLEQRICAGHPEADFSAPVGKDAGMPVGSTPVFRVNHDRVALHDPETGAAVIIDDANQPQMVSWEFQEREKDESSEDQSDVKLPDAKRVCAGKGDIDKIVAKDSYNVDIREGLPTTISLAQLPDLQVPRCSVLGIRDSLKVKGSDGAKAAVVQTNDGIQLESGKGKSFDVDFVLDDGISSPVSSRLHVKVHPANDEPNKPPSVDKVRGVPRAVTLAVAGAPVTYNVLDGTTDPEGDPVTVTDACVGDGCLDQSPTTRQGTKVVFKPDGWLNFTPPAGSTGNLKVSFTATDAWGASTNGSVTVQIKAAGKVPPVTHNDHVRVVWGKSALFDVAANDVVLSGGAPNLADITVESVTAPGDKPGDLAAARAAVHTEDGMLAVDATAPLGTMIVKYQVSDPAGGNNASADGIARIDVVAPGESPKITAIRDDVVARANESRTVDVLANDFDATGGVLAVTRATGPEGVSVQVLPGFSLVKVTLPDEFDSSTGSLIVTYDVSNGKDTVQGTVVVTPDNSRVPQSPVVKPDAVSVRAGNTVGIPVLANDEDPVGATLRLVSVETLDSGQGSVFVEGDELRYTAPATPPGVPVQFHYQVTNQPYCAAPCGESGLVTITVESVDATNRAPRTLMLSERFVQGQTRAIELPLMTADPDGDVVGIAGITKLPAQGDLSITGNGFEFTADQRASGADRVEFLLTDGKKYTTSTIDFVIVPPQDKSLSVQPIDIRVRPGTSRTINLIDRSYVNSTSDTLVVPADGLYSDGIKGNLPKLPSASFDVVYTAPSASSLGTSGNPTETSFRYDVTDGNGDHALNTVRITIDPTAVVPGPIARDDFAQPTHPGKSVKVDLLDNDRDTTTGTKEGLTVKLLDAPSGVSLSAKGVVSLTMPEKSVRFTYEVTGTAVGTEDVKTARAVVSVPIDFGPQCTAVTWNAKANTSKTFSVVGGSNPQCVGPPGSELKLLDAQIADGGGAVKMSDGKVTVTTAKRATTGLFPLQFKVCVAAQKAVSEDVCSVTSRTFVNPINIEGENDPPALAAVLEVPRTGKRTLSLRTKVEDPNPGDEARVTFAKVSSSNSHVKARLMDDEETLAVTADKSMGEGETVTLTVGLDDGHPGGTGTGTIEVRIIASDARPVEANPDRAEGIVGKGPVVVSVLTNDLNYGGEGDAGSELVVQSAEQPQKVQGRSLGKVTSDKTTVTFTPNADSQDFSQPVVFTYTAVDSGERGRTDTAAVSVSMIGYPGLVTGVRPEGLFSSNPGEVALTWNSPQSFNGDTSVSYEIACFESNEGRPGRSCGTKDAGTSSAYTFQGLTNSKTYVFKVRAKNKAGASRAGDDQGWSDLSAPVLVDAYPPPPTITKVGFYATSGSSGSGDGSQVNTPDGTGNQLTVEWNQPTGHGSAVDTFVIQATGPGAHSLTVPVASPPPGCSVTASGGKCAVGGLTAGKNYNFVVEAHNKLTQLSGQTISSPDYCGLHVDDCIATSVPGAPRIETVTYSPGSPSGFRIVINETNTSNQPITRHVVWLNDRQVADTSEAASGGASTTIDIAPGVQGAKTYKIVVQSVNKAGVSAKSAPKETVHHEKPSPIIDARVALVSSRSARFSFTQPGEAGADPNDPGQVTDYEINGPENWSKGAVSVKPGASASFDAELSSPDGTSLTGFTITACNRNDSGTKQCSEPRPVSGSVTPFGPPTGLTVKGTWSGDKIVWNWYASSGIGASGISYVASGGGLSAAKSGATGSGTASTQSYGCGYEAGKRLSVTFKSTQGGISSDPVTAEGSVAAKSNTCDVSETMDDSFLGGTWKRGSRSNGESGDAVWHVHSAPPAGNGGWIDNGSAVHMNCAATGDTYLVHFVGGSTENWNYWARTTDGYWIPIATVFSSNSANGLPTSGDC